MPGFVIPGARGCIKGVPDDDFDPDGAAQDFHNLLSGHGIASGEKKETAITRLVLRHNNAQRQVIRKKYSQKFGGKDLARELKKELSGNFCKAIYALMLQPEECLSRLIHRSIQGVGTDEKTLISLLCYRTRTELEDMKIHYKQKYGKEMEDDVADDGSGDFRTLLISMMNANRSEWEPDTIDFELARGDAQSLYEVRNADLGAREEIFSLIFNSRTPNHMKGVFEAYERFSKGHHIEGTVNSEFEGSLRKAYIIMIKSFRNLVAYNAERLNKAMKGPGTDDQVLIEILVTRSEIDLLDVAELYEARYGRKLKSAVASETSGHYRNVLVNILENKLEG